MIYDFTLLNVPFANGAPSNEIDSFPDFDRGLGIAFDQTDGKPEMKGLNGLFQQITTSIIYLKQRGISDWDNSLEYPIASFVVSGGALYKAKTKNTGKNPSTSQNDWQIWASVSDITVSTNGNLKKTSKPDGSIHLEVPTASDTQCGAMRFATIIEVVNRSNVQASVRPYDLPDLSAVTSNAGYQKIGNLIIQWGSINTNSYMTFPIKFPNSVASLAFAIDNSGRSRSDNIFYYNLSQTGFNGQCRTPSGDTIQATGKYIAIGF